ncbi:MAG: hypothetical protein ABIH34_00835 [Nanoarchaeota archaeon]
MIGEKCLCAEAHAKAVKRAGEGERILTFYDDYDIPGLAAFCLNRAPY